MALSNDEGMLLRHGVGKHTRCNDRSLSRVTVTKKENNPLTGLFYPNNRIEMNEFDELLEGEKQRMDLERKSLEILFPRVFFSRLSFIYC